MPSWGAYLVFAALASAAVTVIVARTRRPASWQPAILTSIGAASIVCFGIVSWGRATPFGDFNKAYYPAGAAILSDPSRLYTCEISNLCFVNIPIVAVLFTPLSFVDRFTAQLLFTAVGVAAVVAAAWLLIRATGATAGRRYAIIALFLLNGPLIYSARLGNLTHALLPLLLVAWICLVRGRDATGGALLGSLAVIKPPLLLFLPYLMARARWRAALAFAAFLGATAAASILWFGLELHALWLHQVIVPFADRPVGAYNVQSISGLLAHLLRLGSLNTWEPVDPSLEFTVLHYALVAAMVAAVGLAAVISGHPRSAAAQWLELGGVLVLALLISPLTWTHYYCFALVPLAAYAGGALPAPTPMAKIALACSAALVTPPVVLALPDAPILGALFARVFVSHYVVGGVVLLAALTASRLAAEHAGSRLLTTTRPTAAREQEQEAASPGVSLAPLS